MCAKSRHLRLIGLHETEDWPTPESLALDEVALRDYERKYSAITLYASGATLESIHQKTGIVRQHLYYLIDRCRITDENGRPAGYMALIGGKQSRTRRRSSLDKLQAGKALPGALQALFMRYPDLRTTMYDTIVHGRPPESKHRDSRLTWAIIQDIFEEECEKLGIAAPDYPFCSDSNGATALLRWGKLEREKAQRSKQFAELLDAANDPWRQAFDPPSHSYERVEFDGHYLDVNWVIEAPGLTGEGVVRVRVSRLWLLALIESKSTAVLGYSISMSSNYSAADVARAIRCSLVPWKPRDLSISTVSYQPGECLPNALDPKLAYVCYDNLWLDNAKSHLADLFLTVLERTVNAVPVFGPRKAPNVRPQIEMIFDLLEEAGFHVLEGTTGSNPKDARRGKNKDHPFTISLEVLCDLIDLLIVRYNTGVCPGTSISRLEVLRRAANRETTVLRRIPLSARERCHEYDLYEKASIGKDRGRPVLRWRNARYFGEGLLRRAGLIGQEVLVMADSEDLRYVEVALVNDGTSLGLLEVERRWRNTPHSLLTRQQVRKEMTHSSFLKAAADLPRAVRRHMEIAAKKGGARRRRQLARLIAEQEAPERSRQNRADYLEAGEPDKGKPPAGDVPTPVAVSPDAAEVGIYDESDAEFEIILNQLGTCYR